METKTQNDNIVKKKTSMNAIDVVLSLFLLRLICISLIGRYSCWEQKQI